MPERCVAGFCSKTRKDGVSLFKFPQNKEIRNEWVRQVQRTRDKWEPSKHSVLCSAHFEPPCFQTTPDLKQNLGFYVQHKRVLIDSAVPTIFPRNRPSLATASSDSQPSVPTKRTDRSRSRALEKRRRLQVIQEVLHDVTNQVQNNQEDSDLTLEAQSGLSGLEQQPTSSSVDSSVQKCDAGAQTSLRPATRSVGMCFHAKGRNKAVQTTVTRCVTVSTQTDITLDSGVAVDEEQQSSDEVMVSDDDEDYSPSDWSSDSRAEDQEKEDGATTSPEPQSSKPSHPVFLIFWTCLVELLSSWCSCPECGNRKITWNSQVIGTLLQLKLKCTECHHSSVWKSQPYYGGTAAGNITLSAAILFAGATATKVLRVLSHMGVAVISTRSFFRHQERVLFDAIKRVWKEHQTSMLSSLQTEGEGLVCGGDGRADSPGHSAKFGTYTLMELRKKAVIDIQLVQSNEVGSSYHMEQEGLERSLEKVQHYAPVHQLVTDRHLSIGKMIRLQFPDIEHLFDIWHLAKSVKKKLQNLSNQRSCHVLKPWISSIVNHLYWSVVSTPAGNTQLILDKWKSVVHHVTNRHQGFTGAFPKCAHGPLEGRERRKRWIEPSTLPSTELEKLVFNPTLCKDIQRLSPVHQTSYVEAFHALINHFAPKLFAFTIDGMECRTMLTALHFNENAFRCQRLTQDGEGMYTVHFPKYKQGGHIVRKVLEKPTFEYVEELMNAVEEMCRGQDYDGDILESIYEEPERERVPLSASCERPDKAEAVERHVSRFASGV